MVERIKVQEESEPERGEVVLTRHCKLFPAVSSGIMAFS